MANNKIIVDLKNAYQELLELSDAAFEEYLIHLYGLCYKTAKDNEDLNRQVRNIIKQNVAEKLQVEKVVKKSPVELTVNFIESSLVVSDNISANIRELKKVSNFILENQLRETSTQFYRTLFEMSPKLEMIMQKITVQSPIEYKYIKSISLEDNCIINMITAYCNSHSIEIKRSSQVIRSSPYHELAPIRLYCEEITQYPVMQKEELFSLFAEYKNSPTKEIRDKIINGNLRLVLKVLEDNFYFEDQSKLDLIQSGNMGLIKAVMSYDMNSGYEFSTYAYPIIRGEISYALKKDNLIHQSHKFISKYTVIKRKINEFYSVNQREPNDNELEAITGMKKETVLRILELKANSTVISLNERFKTGDEGETDELETLISSDVDVEEEVMRRILHKYIRDILDSGILSDIEKAVIEYRFYFTTDNQPTLEEIADKIYEDTKQETRYTRQNIYLILKRALKKIETKLIALGAPIEHQKRL